MNKTGIEWCDYTWNPITGCTPASIGCQNCYAKAMANRLKGRCGYDKDNPFKVTFHPERLDEPGKIKKPSKIFVCSMGDLFHEDVDETWLWDVYKSMEQAPHHKYLILTKRPENIKVFDFMIPQGHVLKRLWFGVTAETQAMAIKRIPKLIEQTKGKFPLFVSCEPILGRVNLKTWIKSLSWVIAGGETGVSQRRSEAPWIIDLSYTCQLAGVAFYFKQWGNNPGWKQEALDAVILPKQFPDGLS